FLSPNFGRLVRRVSFSTATPDFANHQHNARICFAPWGQSNVLRASWRIAMKKLAVVAVVCLTFCLAQGQAPCTPPKIVKTTGTAEIKVAPDRAVIRVGVERQSATAKSAKAAVDNTSRRTLAAR